MKRVNYLDLSSGEVATFQFVETAGGRRFMALTTFDPALPFTVSLLDVVCCLTPVRQPEAVDRETACEPSHLEAELDEATETVEEMIARMAIKTEYEPPFYR
jgi:hypothetical protein